MLHVVLVLYINTAFKSFVFNFCFTHFSDTFFVKFSVLYNVQDWQAYFCLVFSFNQKCWSWLNCTFETFVVDLNFSDFLFFRQPFNPRSEHNWAIAAPWIHHWNYYHYYFSVSTCQMYHRFTILLPLITCVIYSVFHFLIVSRFCTSLWASSHKCNSAPCDLWRGVFDV